MSDVAFRARGTPEIPKHLQHTLQSRDNSEPDLRALLSVHDKSGIVAFGRALVKLGFDLCSTGGTFAALTASGLAVTEVSALTGSPEILDGRVKTLHPNVHGGILARRDIPSHMAQIAKHAIDTIDVVIVNLYPFEQTVLRPDATHEQIIEDFDIGGVALLRAAAKNYADVIVAMDPDQYQAICEGLSSGTIDLPARRKLAARAMQHVAAYDTQVAEYLRGDDHEMPVELTIAMRKAEDLRYGENPHQRAAMYQQLPARHVASTIAGARQHHGRALSFCNLMDLDAALNCVRDFAAPAAVIVKHGNPCGLASADSIKVAYRAALAGDPLSAFGGAVALNRPVDATLASTIAETHFDDIVAPGFSVDALVILRKKRNLRICTVGPTEVSIPNSRDTLDGIDIKRISGGFLIQTADRLAEDDLVFRVVTQREPTEREFADLRFAWRAVKHVKSNAIVLAFYQSLVGIGAGQMSRVDSVELAVKKSGERARGSVLASDAMIPFPDGAEVAALAGVTAIVQPGGSIRDNEVINVANLHGLTMVFTGVRHFRH